MSGDAVTLEIADGIATVTLNRPDKLNALSRDVSAGLAEALEEADREEVRCLVIRGAGRAFCAGGDVTAQQDRLDEGGSGHEATRRIIEACEAIPIRIFEYPVPTIAKVDGYCLGAGMGIAFACDVQLASERAEFGLVFRNVGLTLDYATAYLIPRLVGANTAKELALTGEIISAERAERIGLVNHVFPTGAFDEEADELIRTIAEGPTVALHYSTRNVDRAFEGSIREVVELEAEAQNIASSTADHEEGVRAFAEDREPEFVGR